MHPKKIVITEDNVNRGDFIDVSSVQEYLNGIYSSLDMNIEYEIGNRDHLLVWSTEGIIVIEPYKINDNKISGGVKMELDYLQNVNSTIKESSENYSISDLRKLCAIFSIDTVMNILNDNSFKNKIIPRLRSIIVNQYNDLDFNTVENLINNSGNLIDDVTSLGTSVSENDVEDVRTNLENYKKEALVETFVGTALNMASTSLEYVMILFVEKLEDMNKEQNISLIKNFLIESKNYDWKDKLMEFAKDQKII